MIRIQEHWVQVLNQKYAEELSELYDDAVNHQVQERPAKKDIPFEVFEKIVKYG